LNEAEARVVKGAGTAVRLARKLQPYVQDDAEATRVIERIIKRLDRRPMRGAPVGMETLFAQAMQVWALRRLGGALGATELMAAAVASELVEPEEDKRKMLDRWENRSRPPKFQREVLPREHITEFKDKGEFYSKLLRALEDPVAQGRAAEKLEVREDLERLLSDREAGRIARDASGSVAGGEPKGMNE
jgi:hypothetical protein